MEKKEYEPVRIGDVLKEFLSKHSYIDYRIKAERAVEVWNRLDDTIVREHTRAIQLKSGVLLVKVDSPAISNDLSLKERSYLNKLNKMLGGDIIKKIVFKSGYIKKEERGENKITGDKKPTMKVLKKIDSIVEKVEDEKLKNLLKRLFIESAKR